MEHHEHDTHTHDHTHDHGHDHVHSHDLPGDKTAALLQYMLDHNIHHAAELNDIAQQLSGEARHQLLHAVESFDQANGYLSAALELLKK
ncbi:MAG: cobalt transporter [Oscillospiraceae bacterium]|nr:cobalt transporter [Oscillospiraceae bacterium]